MKEINKENSDSNHDHDQAFTIDKTKLILIQLFTGAVQITDQGILIPV